MSLDTIIRLPQRLIPIDKAYHIVGGAIMASMLCSIPIVATAYLVLISLICIVVAIGIEVYQLISNTGEPDSVDTLATMLGSALVVIPLATRLI